MSRKNDSATPRKVTPWPKGAVSLFVDMRSSTQIVDFIETHYGQKSTSEFFGSFLSRCLEPLGNNSNSEFHLRGDGVLILLHGIDSLQKSFKYAQSPPSGPGTDLPEEILQYLKCNGKCKGLQCPRSLPLEVKCGIDIGSVQSFKVNTPHGIEEELVGSCISISAKISASIPLPYRIGITGRAFDLLQKSEKTPIGDWVHQDIEIAQKFHRVLLL